MNALLIYPSLPDTFWGFKHSLRLIRKKASSPPLGLLTVAGMLPDDWKLLLTDLNISEVTDEDLQKGYEANYGERVRCRAVVLATGGFQPFSFKCAGGDTTGDGIAMAFRAGAAIADMGHHAAIFAAAHL